MKKSLIALAMGAFVLGFAEFVMMGILPVVAAGVDVTVAWAGNFITAYAVGVCVGTIMLVVGRCVPPRRLIIAFMAICAAGNAISALSADPTMLLVGRFIAGLPHGAFFGTATLASKMLADPGREGQAVATMVLGQTVANMIGVPAGTLMASAFSWHAPFVFATGWAVLAAVLIWRFVPVLEAIPDAGLAGQFAFLKAPGPWLILAAVLLGNTGIFCWWSYVSPWLQHMGGFAEAMVPMLLVLAGAGMVVGSTLGGRAADRKSPGIAAAAGQTLAGVALLLIFLVGRGSVLCAALMFLVSVGLFFVSSPQQILMVEVGQGGGELLGGACVQTAFNGGNAIGAQVGQMVLNTGATYNWIGLAGVPFSIVAVALLLAFARRYERQYHLKATGRA
ncbi:MFS transporter [Collinsella tanakaei]|uniref:MFS transporter n=1 Tax=Collinsella tanakaei TaxID=626935 RepID=UPI0025A45681|nr:MFS transporter [Collinsella tanakaei]MDM8246360.1 MFS transporter [Collinsella tanakaei]